MKNLIIAAIAVFTIGAVQAQAVKFGAKAALNIANLSGDIEDNEAKIGFAVGGFVNVKINENFAFQPELLYSTQGSIVKTNVAGVPVEATISLDYLNLPLMMQFNVTDKFSFEAGPQIGFILEAKAKATATAPGGQTFTDTEDIKDNVKSTDFGLNFGTAYDLTKNLNLGVRYNLGLSNINNDNSNDTLKNNVISINLGFTF